MQGFFVFPNRSGERAVWSTAHQEQEEVPMTWVKLLRVTKVLVLAGDDVLCGHPHSIDRGGALRGAG